MFSVDNRKDGSHATNKVRFKRLDSESKKILIISLTIFVIIFLVAYFFIRKEEDNYNKIKEDKSKFLIYTKYEKTNTKYQKHVPFINLKGDVIKQVNKDIDLFANDFIGTSKCLFLYEYDINGIILSIVLKAVDYSTDFASEVHFRSYNINLSTLEVISDEALLDFFGTNEVSVESLIENKFRYFHQDLIKNDYYQADECNYECFLSYRNVQNYLDNVSYYVKDGNLIAYKPFISSSIYGEEEYFGSKDFEFLLVETEKN